VGYAHNSALPLGSYTLFAGQTVGSDAILIRMTRGGDADLDDVVDDAHDQYILDHYASNQWYSGDFDFDGDCDLDDQAILNANKGDTTPVLN
jgi:hypothetical protein